MVKLKEKVDFSNHTIYVGIDVHLKSWNVSICCEQQLIKTFTQPPDTAALQSFLSNSFPGARVKCAYEAGFSGFWLQRELKQIDIDCCVVNAADVPQTDKASKNKTDTNDSRRIAQALEGGLLKPLYVPDLDVEADRQLVRCNERFTNDLTRFKNRVKCFLNYLGIGIPTRFLKSNWSGKFISWLKQLEIKQPSARITLNHLIAMVETTKKEKLSAIRDIKQLLLKDRYYHTAQRLLSVPGLGPITVATFVTEIDDINRFDNFSKLNCFIGLYPSQFSSGENIRMGSMTSRKHNRLRSLLIEAAWVSLRSDPAMAKCYIDLKNKIGGTRAIVKIARKLLSRIRHVWILNEMYENGIIK